MFGKRRQPSRGHGESSRRGLTRGPGTTPAIKTPRNRSYRGLGCEVLESRRLLSSDLTSEIVQLIDNGRTSAPIDLGNVTLGSDFSFSNVTVSFPTGLTESGSNYTGTVSVSATSGSLAIGSAVTAQITGASGVPGLVGTYTLSDQPVGGGSYSLAANQFDLSVSNLLTAQATSLSLDYSPGGAADQSLVDIGSLSATLIPLDNSTITATNLDILNNGFTLGGADVTLPSITLGNILSVDQPALTLSGVGYSAGVFTGTIGLTANSASLFPGQSDFSATANTVAGSYDVATQTLSLSADSFDLGVGHILDAKGSQLSFTLNDSQSPPAATFDAQNLTLTSADFPKATGVLSDLSANNSGFTLGSATLSYAGSFSMGGILSITGLSLGVENFSYTTSPSGGAPTIGGTVTFGAGSVSLFAGQSAFSTTISDPTDPTGSGLSGSYDISTEALTFQLDQVDIKVSDLLEVTATGVAVDIAPGAFGLTVASATATVPKLAGLEGKVRNLAITSDGFTIGSATLGFTGTIQVGSVISIANPSATITNLSYSISGGAQFNGDVNFSFASAGLTVGGLASASITNLSVTLGLMPSDYGQFNVSAQSATLTVGSYVTITAASTPTAPLDFNTAPTSSQDIASFGLVTATFTAGGLTLSGSAQDFAINSSGNFVTLADFGVSFAATDSNLNWPSFLPIKSAALALTWPSGFSMPPTIDLSATIDTTLGGLSLQGSVTNAVIDVNKLINGQFPVTSIQKAGFEVGGTFAGATFKAAGFLGSVVDSSGNSILYGGIDGSVDIAGLAGFEIRLGLSQDGPLDIYAKVDAPIILDPETGLALTDLSAGINFGSGLQTPTSAKDLNSVTNAVLSPTLSQWESQLAADVAGQVAAKASWNDLPSLMTIQGGVTIYDAYASTDSFELTGDIAFDTTGKLLATGIVTVGGSLKVQGSVFIDLSQVASGKAELLMDVSAPAGTPIVTEYGSVSFQFDGPVFNAVQVPTGSSTPQLGTGLSLNGTTAYGTTPNIDLNGSSFTVEFWAQRAATSQEEYVIGQAPASPASTTGLSIGFDSNNNFVVNSGGTSLSFPAGVDTSWHHWAVTFDAATGARSIYRDGILEATDTAAPIEGASTTLLVGKSGSIFFNGGIDEVRVWNNARTAAEIQANLGLMTPSPTTGLLADWSFSEGSGTTAADSSGNSNTLTLLGGVAWAPTVIAGASQMPQGPLTPETTQALQLDGSSAYASASGINLNSTSFTIEFWAKQNDTNRLEYIINQGDPPSSGGLQIGFDASNNFFVSFGGSTLSTPTNDNNWHQWAVTFDATTGQRVIYQDGVPVAGDTASPIAISGATPAFLIGKSGGFYFDGAITQTRVWTVVRTETDIKSDMLSSTPVSTIGLLAAWDFNEQGGTTAPDSSGNGHDATVSGGDQWITASLPTIPTPPFLGFTITLSGGIDLSVPGVPAGLEITGTASFRVDASAASLQLNVTGMVNVSPLGNALDLEGVMHFDLGAQPFTNPQPEFYGIFVLQTGQIFNDLSSYGLNVDGLAVLRFNTTANTITMDLPIPNADPSQPATIQHFQIDPETVSVMIQGNVSFQLPGQSQPWFTLDGSFDAIFQDQNNQPQLDVLFSAYLAIGPTSAPLVELVTQGFLQISSGGVAGELLAKASLAPSVTQALAADGLNFAPINPATDQPIQDQFSLELNTYGQTITFTPPSLSTSDPGLPSLPANLDINIPAAPPNPDGTPGSTPGPYLAISGSGGFELVNSLVVTGSFYLVVGASQFSFEFSDQVGLTIPGDSTPLLSFQAFGGIVINDQGIYGAIQVSFGSGLETGSGFNLGLSAGGLLEVNTMSQPETIANATQSITIPAGPYLDVSASGDLTAGPLVVNASFDFMLSPAGISLEAQGSTQLGPLGTVAVGGAFEFLVGSNGSSAGIVGLIQTNIGTGAVFSGTGFSFSANFEFEINTTSAAQQVVGFTVDPTTGQVTQNQLITIQPGVLVQAGGTLTFVNLINVSGDFMITLTTSSLTIVANAQISGVLGLNASVDISDFSIGQDSQGNPYIIIDASLAFSAGLGDQLFSISASPELMINTETNSYQVAMNNASVTILGFTLSGSIMAQYTGGVFEIEVPQSDPLSLNFFNIGTADVYGYLSSNGQFSLTGAVGFNLSDGSGDSLYGSLSITISDQGFSATVSGGATVFGVNLASVYGSIGISGSSFYVDANVSVWTPFGSIPFGFSIYIGSMSTQYPANTIYLYSVPTNALEGGQVQLDAAATNPDSSSASNYTWTITGPSGFDETLYGADPMLNLGDAGRYYVQLTAGSGNLTESSSIVVANVPPRITSVGTQLAYAAGVTQTITPSVFDPGPSDQNGGLKYAWSLTRNGQPYVPAGVNLNASSLVFTPPLPSDTTYGNPDIYNVTLAVTDTSGATTTASSTFAAVDPTNLMVTTAQDSLNPGQAVSLREALQVLTSSQGSVGTIKFSPSLAYQTITLTSIGDSTDHGNSALAIGANQNVNLDATNVPGITITATQSPLGTGPDMRLFYLAPGSRLTVHGLTLTGGVASGNEDQAAGGAFYVDQHAGLYLENCTLLNNQALGYGASTTSTSVGASAYGGAIYVNEAGNLFALNDTFSGNVAEGYSGGLTPAPGTAQGGAIYTTDINQDSLVALINDTIVGNTAPEGAGFYQLGNASTSINNTILFSNNGQYDYYATIDTTTSGGNNIIGSAGPGTSFGYQSVNPLLGPLADHGHGLLTYSLEPGSPALATGNPAITYGAQFDGRGMPRIDASGHIDIGAFEHQPYIVSNTNDSGPGSLRAAVAADDDQSPIYFASNLANQTILLSSGPIAISRSIAITGPGANLVEIESAAGATAPIAPADLWKGEYNAADSAGSSNGTLVGNIGFASGRVGSAFNLNGGYVAIPPTADVTGTGAFAVSAWIKTTSDGVIIQQRDIYNANGEYQLSVSGGKVYWWENYNNQFGFNMTSNQSVADGQWHYIVATRLANGTGQIYIDGQLDSTQAAVPMPLGSGMNIYIGEDYRDAYYGYGGNNFTGLIDEVAIDHAAPTPLQVAAYYSQYSGGRIFTIVPGSSGVPNVTLTGLTLSGGIGTAGGAIYNAGDLTIVNSVLSDNKAQGIAGAGAGGNGLGGAILNESGAVLTVTGSTFFGDSAVGVNGSGRGGAIYNAPGGQLHLANDTFSGDSASVVGSPASLSDYGAYGGSIDNLGAASIVNTTIADGSVSAPSINGVTYQYGAGVSNESGAALDLLNTIVAQNTGGDDVTNSGFVAGDHNLVTSSTGLPAGVVSVTANPMLEPLAENGGSTPTLALAPGSPAIGAGDAGATLPAIPQGLADWWKFEGNALDSVGGSNGVISNGGSPPTFIQGIAGEALLFNGSTTSVSIPPTADITGTGPFSIGVWIKTSSDGVIIQQRDPNNFNGEFGLSVLGGKINWWEYGDGQYGFNITSNASVADGQWHYIVATRLPDGGGQVYIDGQLDSSQAAPPLTLGSGFNISIGVDARNVYYGSPGDYFNGAIDEVAIYHRAISASDVMTGYLDGASQTETVYNPATPAPAPIPGLAAFWAGNGNTNDSTGNDPGTPSVGVTFGPGLSGQAFQFNGVDTQVNFPDEPQLDTQAFSIGGWFQITQAPAPGSEVYLASKYGGNYNGWILRLNSSLVPTISLLSQSGNMANVSASQPITLDSWYYIAATFDGYTLNLFVNGALAGGEVLPGGYTPSSTPLVLGAASWFSGGFMAGLTSDFSVYNQSLSLAQIQSLSANAGPAVASSGFTTPSASATIEGLSGLWTGGGNALDSTGNDPGTVTSGVTYAAGVNGQAFQLNGQGGQVVIPDSQALDTPSFSIGGWFQITQAPASGIAVLASKYNGNYNGWFLLVNGSLTPTFGISSSPTSNTQVGSSQSLRLNTWYYIAATYDGNNATLSIDGAQVGSATLADGYTPSPTALVLGGASWFPAGYTTGLINDFSMYNRALTPDEIQSLAFNTAGMPLVDQRGFSRLQNGATDIGAYEVQPFLVTNTNDSGRGSLRAAVAGDVSGDVPIVFAPGLAGQTITLLSPIPINHDVTITGLGANQLTISGAGTTQLFDITSGTVTITGLTLSGGVATQGGAINNAGSLILNGDMFTNDHAVGVAGNPSASGGAVFIGPGASLSAVDTTFMGDQAVAASGGAAAGGAIDNQGGSLILTNDTLANNLAEGGASGTGGAIDNASILNSDGSVNQTGMAKLVNVTITANTLLSSAGTTPTSPVNGAGLENEANANLILYNTIVANDVGGPDVVNLGTITGDSNMIPTSTGVPAGAIFTTANPLLGSMQNNGGTTLTAAPAPQSAALDNGDNSVVTLATDQNGNPRIIGGQVDIGAVEFNGPIYVLNTNDSGGDSLRSAIQTAALYPDSPVVFDPSLAGKTITLASEILITHNVVIDATATPGIVLSGGGLTRLFEIAPGYTVTLRGLTIEGGSATTGGGILNNGTLTLDSTTLTQNHATVSGGAIQNNGVLTLVDDTIAGNSTAGVGGGIDNTWQLNSLNSTIADNTALVGGGVSAETGTVTARDTIIAANTATKSGADFAGTLASLGNNLIGNPAGASGFTKTDLTGVTPLLGTLQNNGGDTPTMALLQGSPALGTGTTVGAPADDQRGLPRVVDGTIDIGAYQSQYAIPTASAGVSYAIRAGQSLTLNATGSTASKGDSLTYSWDLTGTGVFGDASGSTPTLSWSQLVAMGIQPRSTPYQVRVIVSDGYGQSHQVISAPVPLTVLPAVWVVQTTTASMGPRGPVDSATVTFGAAINPASFNTKAISLSRDGGPNLITHGVSMAAVPGEPTTYRISGLAPLTRLDGHYTLAINMAAITGPYGPGQGVQQLTWSRDTIPPVSTVNPLPAREPGLSFPVTVSAVDRGPGALGIAYDEIYVSNDGGRFTPWTSVPASDPTAVYAGLPGHTYAFRSVAHDLAGNVERMPTRIEAKTTLPGPITRSIPFAHAHGNKPARPFAEPTPTSRSRALAQVAEQHQRSDAPMGPLVHRRRHPR